MHNLIRMQYPELDRGQLDTEKSNPDLVPGDWRTEPHFDDVEEAAGNIDSIAGKRQWKYRR
jgi:hypothetical protein